MYHGRLSSAEGLLLFRFTGFVGALNWRSSHLSSLGFEPSQLATFVAYNEILEILSKR